jgi:hypothetical protein
MLASFPAEGWQLDLRPSSSLEDPDPRLGPSSSLEDPDARSRERLSSDEAAAALAALALSAANFAATLTPATFAAIFGTGCCAAFFRFADCFPPRLFLR